MHHVENDDYLHPSTNAPVNPLRFPSCLTAECVRMTVRVYNPDQNTSKIHDNVLVRTPSYSFSDSDSDSEDEAMDDHNNHNNNNNNNNHNHSSDVEDRAYLLHRTLMDCIYGRVLLASVLKRRSTKHDDAEPFTEWENTREKCAVKEMSCERIQRSRHQLAEDPIAEINAMAYMAKFLIPDDDDDNDYPKQQQQQRRVDSKVIWRTMEDSHILLPMDLPLSDGRYLYSVMPYCNGGELFGMLDGNGKFTEPQARYWMHQILSGIETLQNIGICHKDISLENILVHNKSCFIMDFGMTCQIPYTHIAQDSSTIASSATRGKRKLILPSGVMGKWNYMSPEIAANTEPFDGHAVDLFAVGAILFTMVTGYHGWERPMKADEHFRCFSGGYLQRMLVEWKVGLTEPCMDLLQRMVYFSPEDRLSLAQIRAHEWMQGEVEEPIDRPPWA